MAYYGRTSSALNPSEPSLAWLTITMLHKPQLLHRTLVVSNAILVQDTLYVGFGSASLRIGK